ncbi:hypothetical protein C475_20717 [Halosimplex carlsbadense 2-9-1]|uniref:Uncharacterized protein n=1 Tax=Halosimplex carlsbadense 2-9-1 TaxID=797114 RepID=M0CAG7_9EURY|nr:hypothetical protein [Halosimplex carlsbadense]ELZ20235.1 hypothetical protein C475_20717 [Halosimplex carlsbadense 2-9-1]
MADEAGDDEEEWRFSVDEVGDDTGDVEEADTLDGESNEWDVTVGDEDDDGPTVAFGGTESDSDSDGDGQGESEGGGNVAGSVTPDLAVESDTPSLESAVFVAAGALLVLLVLASVVTQLTPRTIGAVTLGVTAVTAVVYAVFVRF